MDRVRRADCGPAGATGPDEAPSDVRRSPQRAAPRRPPVVAGWPASRLHAGAIRLEGQQAVRPHLARAGRRRQCRAADQWPRERDEPALVARRDQDRLSDQARRQRRDAALCHSEHRRRGAGADSPPDRRVAPDVVARRAGHLLPRPRRSAAAGGDPREGQRRRLCVRRELQVNPSLEGDRRHGGRSPGHERRLLGPRVPTLAGWTQGRVPAGAEPALWLLGPGRGVGDGRRRHPRAAVDEERGRRKRRCALAGQLAGALPDASQRAFRDVLQPQDLRRPGWRRPAAPRLAGRHDV